MSSTSANAPPANAPPANAPPDLATMIASATPLNVSGLMADIDAKIASRPYVMPDVEAIFPLVFAGTNNSPHNVLKMIVFWAANVNERGHEATFKAVTRWAKEMVPLIGRYVEYSMDPSAPLEPTIIATETERLAALVDALAGSSAGDQPPKLDRGQPVNHNEDDAVHDGRCRASTLVEPVIQPATFDPDRSFHAGWAPAFRAHQADGVPPVVDCEDI
jgi:hypothetical protein